MRKCDLGLCLGAVVADPSVSLRFVVNITLAEIMDETSLETYSVPSDRPATVTLVSAFTMIP
jgi:hypothetical protein